MISSRSAAIRSPDRVDDIRLAIEYPRSVGVRVILAAHSYRPITLCLLHRSTTMGASKVVRDCVLLDYVRCEMASYNELFSSGMVSFSADCQGNSNTEIQIHNLFAMSESLTKRGCKVCLSRGVVRKE